MNKKILVGITIAIVAIAVIVGLKTILGDNATELPGEESTEKTLKIQETNNSINSTKSVESGSESSESGP